MTYADHNHHHGTALLQQYIHDLCLVRPSEESFAQALADSRPAQLWGIAFFEYLLQVPANRLGFQVMNIGQLKILQEVITLTIFIPFSIFFMKENMRLDYVWAGLCILGAVFFIFRGKMAGACL